MPLEEKKKGGALFITIAVVTVAVLALLGVSVYFSLRPGDNESILMDSKKETFQNSYEIIFRHKNSTLWCEPAKSMGEKYGIIIDGGTTRTCSMLYVWDKVKFQGTGCVKEIQRCCNLGGLVQLNPVNQMRRLIQCVNTLLNVTETTNKEDIPIYLTTTGAMRSQKLANSGVATEIMDFINITISKKFKSAKDIQIISENNEAVYRWIATNYLRNGFKESTLYGSMNLADDSLDISFEKPMWLPDENYEFNKQVVSVFGKTYTVLFESSLCFSKKNAKSRYKAFLIMQDFQKTEIEDPCMPLKHSTKILAGDLFQNYCTHNTRFTEVYRNDSKMLDNEYTFKGTSNPKYCRGNISLILDIEHCTRLAFSQCIRKITVPKYLNFLAYSEFYNTVKFLNASGMSYRKFEITVDEFCRKDKNRVDQYVSVPKIKRTQLCFNANYIILLITEIYGFNKYIWSNITFAGDDYEEDLTWNLGHMIDVSKDI